MCIVIGYKHRAAPVEADGRLSSTSLSPLLSLSRGGRHLQRLVARPMVWEEGCGRGRVASQVCVVAPRMECQSRWHPISENCFPFLWRLSEPISH